MAGTKLKLLKEAVGFILDTLNDKDRLSLVSFNDKAKRLTPLQLVNKTNKKNIMNSVNAMKASGGTDISGAMDICFNILKQKQYHNPINSVLLLSDGDDEEAYELIKQRSESLKFSQGFTINTFGLGADHDAILLDDIAKIRDGSFYYIEKAD